MNRMWLAAGIALVIGVGAHAQGGGGGGSGLTGGGGGSGLTGGGGGSGLTGGGSGLTGGGNSFTGGSTGGSTRTGVGGRSSGSTAVSSSNFLAASYGNPLYPGRPGSTNINISAGGGFGTATLSTTGANTRTTTGGTGNRTGGTAAVGGQTGNTQNAITRISYTTSLDFPVRAVVSKELQDELRQLVARSSSLKAPERITVAVEGNTVTLTGVVSDDAERRLVEGMIRLTPGVQTVRNELQTP